MKIYNELTSKQQALFVKLREAITQKNEDISDILKSDDIQDIFDTWVYIKHDDTVSYYTFLTFAIRYHPPAANVIVNTANSSVLKEFLTRKLFLYDNNTMINTALSFAQKQGHNDLVENIRQKMQDVELEVPGESPSQAFLIHNNKKEFLSRTANNLFWSVLRRDTEAANQILDDVSQNTLPAQMFQSGWMKTLFINGKKALELAIVLIDEDNETIIKTIRQRQAIGVGIGGALLLAGGIPAGIFINPLLFAVAAIGLVICAYTAYHGLKQLPSAEVSEVKDPVPQLSTENLQANM